jgi:hypothetical protein
MMIFGFLNVTLNSPCVKDFLAARNFWELDAQMKRSYVAWKLPGHDGGKYLTVIECNADLMWSGLRLNG